MITVNLLPPEFRHKRPKQFKLPPFVSPKGLLFFLGALVCIEILLAVNLGFFADKKFDKLQARYRDLGPALKEVRGIRAQAGRAQEVERQLKAWMNPPVTWTAFMNALSDGMEKGVWLTHLSFERKEFDLPPAAQTALPARPGRVTAQPAKEQRTIMMIRGRAAVDQEEAAAAGRFIEKLMNEKAISDLTEDLRLDEIRRTPDSKTPMFDFVILGTVKREREKDFFNLK